MAAPEAPAPAEAEAGGGGTVCFSKKDMQVDWDKVSRVAPLVDQALGAKSGEPAVVANARKLEKFYPHLVRWDVTRSNSVRAAARHAIARARAHARTRVLSCVRVSASVPLVTVRTRAPGAQGANIRNMVELFRLTQVVLEARTMQHQEQESGPRAAAQAPPAATACIARNTRSAITQARRKRTRACTCAGGVQ
jgi:hypothetical protein